MLEYAEAEVGTVQMNLSDIDDSHLRFSSASVNVSIQPSERTHGDAREGRLESTGDNDDDVTRKLLNGDEVEVDEMAQMSLRSMHLLEKGGGGIASVVDGSSSNGDGVSSTTEKRQDGGGAIASTLPSVVSSSVSGRELQGKAVVENHDPEEKKIPRKFLPDSQKYLGAAVLPSKLPARTTRSAFRKPLGKVQSTGGERNGGKLGSSAAVSAASRGEHREKTEVCRDEEAKIDGELKTMEEEISPIMKRKRGQKEGKGVENGKRKKTKSREETRRCRAPRYVRASFRPMLTK